MNKIKRFLPTLFVTTVVMFFFASPVSAQFKINCLMGHVANLDHAKLATGTDVEDNYKVAAKFFYSAGCVFLEHFAPELTTTPTVGSGLPKHMEDGLLGMLENQLEIALNNPPRFDLIGHFAQEWVPGNDGASRVYAAGYDDLMSVGIVPLWSLSRNIAYLGFVIIMIIIGFLIMFKSRARGQMVVTIGNAIPRIVISLIIVTFSFAIAGILLDISGILMRILKDVFGGSSISIFNIEELLRGTLGILGESVLNLSEVIGTIVNLLTGTSGSVVGSISIVLITLVVTGIIIWGIIKLWVTLIKSYLIVLFTVVFSPIATMVGAAPGNNSTIINIFKTIFRASLVFPIAYFIINLPYFVGDTLPFSDSLIARQDASPGEIILAFAKVIALFVAAKSPILAEAIIPVTEDRNRVDINTNLMRNLGRVPLLGKMVGSSSN